MTVDDFVAKWNGKALDFDGAYGNQLSIPIPLLSFFACANSFFIGLKSTKIKLPVVNFNNSTPLTSFAIPPNSSYARGVIGADATVSEISRVLGNSEISRPIIERIKVYVVNIISSFSTSYQSMQVNNAVRSALLKVRFTPIERYIPFTATITKLLRKPIPSGIEFTDKLTMLTTNYSEFFHIYIISGATHKSKELLV